MKKLLSIISLTALLLAGCAGQYDDTALKEKIDALSSQVAKCIQQVNDLNTQVQGLNAVIEQWKKGGFVESVQEINGGYTITFVGGQTVTIYNGKDGKDGNDGNDGHSPVVSIKADADGNLYWAVDGEWLLDAQGQKVPVTVTPSFSINEKGELIVTIAGVEQNLGLVQGAGNSIFESVVPGNETVVFTLVSGLSFEIPMVKAFKLVIDTKQFTEVSAGDQIAIPYTVQNGDGASVMAFAGGLYKASVDESAKTINVVVPSPAADGQVMAWAQTETLVSPIIILSFTAGQGGGQQNPDPQPEVVIVSNPQEYQSIPMAGGPVAVSLTSNVDIVVAQPSVSWVTAVLTKADYTLSLEVAENTGAPRSTDILIQRADNGATVQTVHIAQLGTVPQVSTTEWDFSQQTWQDAFAALGEPTVALAAVNLTISGLQLVADANAKYGTTYFQTPGSGSTSKNYFKFTASEDGVVTVAESHTGSTAPDPIRNVVVYNNGAEQSLAGSINSKNISNLKFNVKAGEVYVYGTGGMRFYKISFAAGETYDPENPGEETAEGELECTTPPTVGTVDMTAMYGYAAAANVTGGGNATGADVLHFNNGKALQTWLLARTKSEKAGDHTPKVIWLSGTFTPTDGRDFSEAHPWFDVKDVSNLSFYGTDGFVMDRIGIFCVRASNIIIRNINFQQPKANNGADAVSMQECDGVWVDHCTFTSLNQTKDYEDGSTDVTHGSKNVTVSWCRYIKTQKSCLVGHSNSQSSDAAITATFHHNWFDGSSSRHPRVRFGRAHVYNNLFDGCTTYGVGSAYGAKVLVEYNYFDGVQLPTDICTYPAKESNESNLQGSVAGYLYPTQNVYVNRPAKAKDPYPLSNVQYTSYGGSTITPLTYADFAPSYSYTVTAAEDVPTVVKAGAGYGKLGWTEAPIAANNGGITEFNGTDDDPTNPDTGDEDEPVVVDDGATHTYTLSMQSKALVQTMDGVAGATYFEASTNVADFSKDYSGSFTIDGVTYTQGIKMDSGGYVNFTTSASCNTTIRFYSAVRKQTTSGAKMQLIPSGADPIIFKDITWATYYDSGEVSLEKGTSYTLKQASGEQGLILVIIKQTE